MQYLVFTEPTNVIARRLLVVIFIWLLTCVGAIALVFGLRGRVVAKQLRCKWCGYDLEGIHRTPQSKCPECGNGVWVGAKVNVTRQARHGVLRVSYLCFVLCFGLLAIHVANRFELIDWYRFRSTNALVEQIRATSNSNPQARAWTELSRRRTAHQLNDDVVGDIMAIALDRYLALFDVAPTRAQLHELRFGERGIRPQPEHVKWILAACSERLISTDAVSAYLRRLFQPTVDVQMSRIVYTGQPLKAVIMLGGKGLGGLDSAQAVAMLEGIQVDGVDHGVDDWTSIPLVLDLSPTTPTFERIVLDVPIHVAPGARQITLRFRVGVTHLVIGQGPTAISIGQPMSLGAEWPRTLCEETVSASQIMDGASGGR